MLILAVVASSLGERDWGKKPMANFRALRAFGWFDMTSDALWAFLKTTPGLEVRPFSGSCLFFLLHLKAQSLRCSI